jgi:uncharacterized protein with von Willebrand factor type A (vWA) domain
MNERDPKTLLLAVFDRLRRHGFALGVGELLVAYRAVDGGWGRAGPEALRPVARLLWCHSPEEVAEFEEIYGAALAELAPPASAPPREEPKREPPPLPPELPPVEPPPVGSLAEPPPPSTELAPLPVRTSSRPPPGETGPELRAYWPLSRRSMIYAWRYLRRPVKDGPRDVLDVAATVEQTARQGFFLRAVYDRRPRNYAHLVLLVDQGGSMVPFHRFTRDLVETARDEQASQIRQVEVAYFQNVPPPHVFLDPHLTESRPLERLLAGVTPDTSVLLVSDAGAARGYRSTTRIRATAEFLVELKRRTTLIAWLNPMPQSRWASTSAQFIARLAPHMFQMDRDGFGNAIDALRGQRPHARR